MTNEDFSVLLELFNTNELFTSPKKLLFVQQQYEKMDVKLKDALRKANSQLHDTMRLLKMYKSPENRILSKVIYQKLKQVCNGKIGFPNQFASLLEVSLESVPEENNPLIDELNSTTDEQRQFDLIAEYIHLAHVEKLYPGNIWDTFFHTKFRKFIEAFYTPNNDSNRYKNIEIKDRLMFWKSIKKLKVDSAWLKKYKQDLHITGSNIETGFELHGFELHKTLFEKKYTREIPLTPDYDKLNSEIISMETAEQIEKIADKLKNINETLKNLTNNFFIKWGDGIDAGGLTKNFIKQTTEYIIRLQKDSLDEYNKQYIQELKGRIAAICISKNLALPIGLLTDLEVASLKEDDELIETALLNSDRFKGFSDLTLTDTITIEIQEYYDQMSIDLSKYMGWTLRDYILYQELTPPNEIILFEEGIDALSKKTRAYKEKIEVEKKAIEEFKQNFKFSDNSKFSNPMQRFLKNHTTIDQLTRLSKNPNSLLLAMFVKKPTEGKDTRITEKEEFLSALNEFLDQQVMSDIPNVTEETLVEEGIIRPSEERQDATPDLLKAAKMYYDNVYIPSTVEFGLRNALCEKGQSIDSFDEFEFEIIDDRFNVNFLKKYLEEIKRDYDNTDEPEKSEKLQQFNKTLLYFTGATHYESPLKTLYTNDQKPFSVGHAHTCFNRLDVEMPAELRPSDADIVLVTSETLQNNSLTEERFLANNPSGQVLMTQTRAQELQLTDFEVLDKKQKEAFLYEEFKRQLMTYTDDVGFAVD